MHGKFQWCWMGFDTWIGCGRFFEGDAAQMNKALNETLASLPDDTKVYVSFFFLRFSRPSDLWRNCLTMLRFRAAMNTPRRMWISSLLYQTPMRSRSFKLLQRAINRHRVFSLLGMKRLVWTLQVYGSVMMDTDSISLIGPQCLYETQRKYIPSISRH